MEAIKTINLTKKYKDLVAVNNLNLQIEQGELFSLLGSLSITAIPSTISIAPKAQAFLQEPRPRQP